MKRAKVIAITGGTGCGQSTVSNILASKFRCKVIHADVVAKQLVDTNPDIKEIIKEKFGKQYFSRKGELKRKEFGQYVFSDKNATQKLNKIVHPVLVEELILEIEEAQEKNKYNYIIIDAALIYEMALERYFDAVVTVYSPKQKRIKRIIQRDGITQKEVLDRMANQFELADKKSWADFVVDNSKDMAHLENEVKKLFSLLKTVR